METCAWSFCCHLSRGTSLAVLQMPGRIAKPPPPPPEHFHPKLPKMSCQPCPLSCSEIPSKLSCLDRILQESLLLKKLPVPRKATNPSISSSLIVFMQTALTPGYFSTVGNEGQKEGGAGQSPPKTCCIGEKGGSGIIPLLLQMRKLRPSVLSDWSRVPYQ